MSALEQGKTEYWPQLDGLRTLAFMMVFLHHHGAPSGLPHPIGKILDKLAEWGWLGVDLFFILSAFLVTHLLCTEQKQFGTVSLSKFYARRALRIWPLYFTVLTVCCFIYPLFAPQKASHLYSLFLQQIAAPLFTFTGNSAIPWNFSIVTEYAKLSGLDFMIFVTVLVPFWSLCIEEQFYLLWGLGARLSNNIKTLVVCACIMVLVGFVARFFLLSAHREQVAATCYYMNSFWHLDTIMLGALLALVGMVKPQLFDSLKSGWLPPTLLVGTIGTFIGAVMFGPSIHSWDYALAPMMTAVSVAGCAFLALALHWPPVCKLLSLQWMMHIGKLTFGMYVFHFAVCYLAKKYLALSIVGLQGLGTLLLCFFLTWMAAVISWKVLEKPMNDMRRRLTRVCTEKGETGGREPLTFIERQRAQCAVK